MSNLCPGMRDEGVHLFRLPCLVVLWTGRDTSNKYCCHVAGGLVGEGRLPHSGLTTQDCHSPQWHVLPRSTLLRFLCAPGGHCPRWAVHLFPSQVLSHSGDQVLSKHTVPGGLCILCTLPVQGALFPGCS